MWGWGWEIAGCRMRRWPPIPPSHIAPSLHLIPFDRDGHRLIDARGDRCAWRQHRFVAAPGHDRCAAGARSGRGADRCAFAAADNRADDGAANRTAAHFLCAAVGGRVAVSVDRLGVDRDARAVGEDERVEADAEACALLELAAALDERHRSDGPCAGRNSHATAQANVTGDTCVHAVLDARRLAGDPGLSLEA